MTTKGSTSRRRAWTAAVRGPRRMRVILVISGMALIAASPAAAGWATGPAVGNVEGERDWGVELVPYGWLAGVTGKVGAVPPTGATTTAVIEFDSITDTLNGAFMATLELRWRRWRLMNDVFWTRFEDSAELPAPYTRGTWTASLTYGTVGVAYELPFDIGPAIDFTASARWWRLGVGLALDLETPPGGSLAGDDTVLWADAVFGLRVRQHIAENWHVWARGDVGGGAAKIDWSLEAGMGWDVNRHFGLVAAYRLLGVNFEGKGYLYDVTQTGLLVGLRLAY